MSRLANHAILDALSKTQLVELARRHGIALAISQSKTAIVGSLAGLTHNEFRQLLQSLSQSELRAICRIHGLSYSEEATNTALVDRILGPPPTYLGLVRPKKKFFSQDGETSYQQSPSTSSVTVPHANNEEFFAKLWMVIEKNQSKLPITTYRSLVLGLLFLKFVNELFARYRRQCLAQKQPLEQTEDPYMYQAAGVFWLPPMARWSNILARTQNEELSTYLEKVIDAIETSNPSLKEIFPESIRKCSLDHIHLGELIEVLTTLGLMQQPSSIYHFFGQLFSDIIDRFANLEREQASHHYTAKIIRQLLVEMLAPEPGIVYDPSCGSGGFLIQAAQFMSEQNFDPQKASFLGTDLDRQTWQIARMNLMIHGFSGHFGNQPTNALDPKQTFSIRAHFIFSHPPLFSETQQIDVAWISHIHDHLGTNGFAAILVPDDINSNSGVAARKLRKTLVLDDVLDCVLALPQNHLFPQNTPYSLWILAINKQDPKYRNRRGRVLLIDARQLGTAVDRNNRELSHSNISQVASIYHAWRGDNPTESYFDLPQFCKSVTIDEIGKQNFVFIPNRFIGTETEQPASLHSSFVDAFPQLALRLEQQFAKANELESRIRQTLELFKL